MVEYMKNLRKAVGHIPILVCGACVIVENDKGEIKLKEMRRLVSNGCKCKEQS
jgi:hypothetical protein